MLWYPEGVELVMPVTESGKDHRIQTTIRLPPSVYKRAKSLIEIAHPAFREELYEYCEKTKWAHGPQQVQTAAPR